MSNRKKIARVKTAMPTVERAQAVLEPGKHVITNEPLDLPEHLKDVNLNRRARRSMRATVPLLRFLTKPHEHHDH